MSFLDSSPTIVAAVDALHAHTAIYTAAPVVEALIARIGWPDSDGRLLDPGAGDGAFVCAALRALAPAPGDMGAAGRVLGLEIHPSAVAEARENVAQVLVDLGWNNHDAVEASFRSILHRDYLVEGCGDFAPTMIAGNPPYMRFARLPEEFKTLYADLVPRIARGDLQHAFLDRCRHDLAAGGVIAFVTADRWLLNDSSGPLRESLGETMGVSHLVRLDVESCFYRPKSRRKGTAPRVHPIEIVLKGKGAEPEMRALGARAMSPDSLDEVEQDRTLAHLATVRLAPYVGPSGGFLLTAEEASRFPQEMLIPAIDLDDVDFETGLVGQPRRFVLSLDPKVEPQGVVREHLLAQRERMPKKVRNGKWWRPPENPDIRLDMPSLLIPRIKQSLRAVVLEAGVLPVNHNLSIVTDSQGTGLMELRDRLLSQPVQDWVVQNAPRLEDGFLDIRTNLIRRIPAHLLEMDQPLALSM